MDADTTALLLTLVPLLLAVGAAAGVLAGLLGVGGGIVVVPALYYIFGYLNVDDAVRMHLAVGTSLATIVPTSIRSVRAHHSRGSFDSHLFKTWMPGIVAGVLFGTWLAALSDFATLTLVFAVVATFVAVYMALGNPKWQLANELPPLPVCQLIAATIGTISAMMGIGGGTMTVPALNLFGVPIHRAVGTSAGFGLIIAVPGAFGFMVGGWGNPALPDFSLGYVNLLGLALIVPMTVLTVPLGARLAHTLSIAGLRRAFALFLGLTALRMFIDIS